MASPTSTPTVPFTRAALTALACLATASAWAEGLRTAAQDRPAWQARVASVGLAGPVGGERVPSLALMGDWFIDPASRPEAPAPSGLRASSGLLLGGNANAGLLALSAHRQASSWSRGLSPGGMALRESMPAEDSRAQPYVGLGYSHDSANDAWGVSADLGMLGQASNSPGWQLGRALLGPSRLDEAVRNLRWRPILQVSLRLSY